MASWTRTTPSPATPRLNSQQQQHDVPRSATSPAAPLTIQTGFLQTGTGADLLTPDIRGNGNVGINSGKSATSTSDQQDAASSVLPRQRSKVNISSPPSWAPAVSAAPGALNAAQADVGGGTAAAGTIPEARGPDFFDTEEVQYSYSLQSGGPAPALQRLGSFSRSADSSGRTNIIGTAAGGFPHTHRQLRARAMGGSREAERNGSVAPSLLPFMRGGLSDFAAVGLPETSGGSRVALSLVGSAGLETVSGSALASGDLSSGVPNPVAQPKAAVEDPHERQARVRLTRLTRTPYSFSAFAGTMLETRQRMRKSTNRLILDEFFIVKIDVAPPCDGPVHNSRLSMAKVELQRSFKTVRFSRNATADDALATIAQKNVSVAEKGLFVPARADFLPFGRWIVGHERLVDVLSSCGLGVAWLELRSAPFTQRMYIEPIDNSSQDHSKGPDMRQSVLALLPVPLDVSLDPFALTLDALNHTVGSARAAGVSVTSQSHALFLEFVHPVSESSDVMSLGSSVSSLLDRPPPLKRLGLWINHSHDNPRMLVASIVCDYPLPQRGTQSNSAVEDVAPSLHATAFDVKLCLRPRMSQPVTVIYAVDDDYGNPSETREELVVDPFWTVVLAKRYLLKHFNLVKDSPHNLANDSLKEHHFKLLLCGTAFEHLFAPGESTHIWMKERTQVGGVDGMKVAEPLYLVDYFNEFCYNSSSGTFTIQIRRKFRNVLIQLPDGKTHSITARESDSVDTVLRNFAKKDVVRLEADRVVNFGLFRQRSRLGDDRSLTTESAVRYFVLDGRMTLTQHGIDLGQCLFLRNRYPLSCNNLSQHDEVAIHFTFCQLYQQWMTGTLRVGNQEVLVALAALAAQAEFGDYELVGHSGSSSSFFASHLGIRFPDVCRSFEDAIVRKWQQHSRSHLPRMDAKYRYIQLCKRPLNTPAERSLPSSIRAKVATKIAGSMKRQQAIEFSPSLSRNSTDWIDRGPLEVSARGLTRAKVQLPKILHAILDFKRHMLILCELDRGRVHLELTNQHLDVARIERHAVDPTQMMIANYRDDDRSKEGLASCELVFRTPSECDLVRAFLNVSRGLVSPHTLRIWTGTWNLGGAAPPALHDWLPSFNREGHRSNSAFSASSGFDIIVVATQEGRWSSRAEKKASTQQSTAADVSSDVNSEIGPSHLNDGPVPAAASVNSTDNLQTRVHQHIGVERFELLASSSMWEISILVFVSRSVRHMCTGVSTATRATGIANVCGNKGGVAVAFSVLETSLCFVNSHLPARHTEERLADRNADYRWLVDALNVGAKGKRGADLLNQFDHVFWLGDLNYRVDLSRDRIQQHHTSGNFSALIAADQLRAQISEERAFSGFCEGSIGFPPTYRWERNAREWSKKKLQNTPSYTDRILWRSTLAPHDVTQREYRWADTMLTSDHRPVSAVFTVEAHTRLAETLYRNPDEVYLCPGQVMLYDLAILLVRPENLPIAPDAQLKDFSCKFTLPGVMEHSLAAEFKKDVRFTRWLPDESMLILGPFRALSPLSHRQIRVRCKMRADKCGTATIAICPEPVTPSAPSTVQSFRAEILCKGVVWGEIVGVYDVVLFGRE